MEKAGATPSGLGNQCSVEFNLAYRWHSTISQGDEKWIEQIYHDLMGKPAEEVTMPELLMGMKKVEGMLDADPSKRTFAHLQRQEDGTFKDEELVAILKHACEDVASKSTQEDAFPRRILTRSARLLRSSQHPQGPSLNRDPRYRGCPSMARRLPQRVP